MSEELNDNSPPAGEAAHVEGSSEETKNTSPSAARVKDQPDSRSTPAKDRHLFGLKTTGIYTGQQDVSDDYEKRFPEDAMFEETGPTARVWRTYLVESMAFDENMVGEARDGLDAMLVFAGLFSAVVTSFLVQTSENLQPDYTQMTASLLSELITVQRAASNGTSVNTVPAAALNPNTRFTPDTLDVWVNGLWVVSLTLSLVVALSAVLIKQWLHRYIALRSGTPKDRSHIRHSRFIGFEKWRVLGIVGALPVIMHLSLWFFLLGLVIFLIPLQLVLSCIIGALAFIAYALYLISNILPVFIHHCPYQTPLSDYIVVLFNPIRGSFLRLRVAMNKVLGGANKSSLLLAVTDDASESLSVQALHWLFEVSTNPSVHSVVLQAIGGVPATAAPEVGELFGTEKGKDVLYRLLNRCRFDDRSGSSLKPDSEPVAERLMRTAAICNWELTNFGVLKAALETWKESDSARDPTYLATALSSVRHDHVRFIDNMTSDLRQLQYILSHHNLPHHRLVWKALLRNSMSGDVFSDYAENPVLFRILFPATFGDTEHVNDQTIQPMAEAVLVDHDLHQELREHLLSMVPFDNDASGNRLAVPADKIAERLLTTILEYAFHRLSAEPSNFESVHWQIIDEAYSHFFDDMIRRQHHMQSVFKNFSPLLIQQTDLCDSRPRGSEAFLKLRRNVLDVYLHSTWGRQAPILHKLHDYIFSGHIQWISPVFDDILSKQNHESVFLRAIEQALSDIPLVNGQMREHVDVLFSILASGLLDGLASAYTLVVEHDCLGLALKQPYPGSFNHSAVELAGAYAIGLLLHTQIDAATRECSIAYLFRPRNLHIVMISYIVLATWGPSWDETRELNIQHRGNELVRLRPDQKAWDDCRRWLRHVLKWEGVGRKAEDAQELEDADILERMLPRRLEEDRLEMIERFVLCLDKPFANDEESTDLQGSGPSQPHTTPLDFRARVASPTPEPEVNAGEAYWKLPRWLSSLRGSKANQGSSGMELGAV